MHAAILFLQRADVGIFIGFANIFLRNIFNFVSNCGISIEMLRSIVL